VKDQEMSADQPSEKNIEDSERRLRALIAEHEARLNEVADLVARVRHEINNPLTGVLGQAQLLLREELSQTARRRAETIEQLATRIRDIVAQLRDVQRPKKQEAEVRSQKEKQNPEARIQKPK
jgi:signal transduction histidine kinase